MKRLFVTLLFIGAVASPPRAAIVQRETLAVPGRTNANVSLAAGAGLVVAAWSASSPNGDTDIYAAMSRDAGISFTSPVRVNSVQGDARVNGEQPPRVTVASRPGAPPVTTVVWTSKKAQGTILLHARSEDGGRTFGHSSLVPGTSAPGNRGWENVSVDLDGRTRVTWLDHREMADGSASSGHKHPGHAAAGGLTDGVTMAQKSKLYVATVGDVTSARAIASGVCYCCKTAMATGLDGTIYLAWRHVYSGNLRDIAFTLSRDGGRTFAQSLRVSNDGWQLNGCPDDGPAMALDRANGVHIAWPTLIADGPGKQPSIGIFYAQSRNGQRFSDRERLMTQGLAHHPQIMVNGNRLFVAWDELQDGRRRIVVAQRSTEGTAVAFSRTVVAEGTGLLYPTLAPSGAGVLVAWTAGQNRSTIQLARVE